MVYGFPKSETEPGRHDGLVSLGFFCARPRPTSGFGPSRAHHLLISTRSSFININKWTLALSIGLFDLKFAVLQRHIGDNSLVLVQATRIQTVHTITNLLVPIVHMYKQGDPRYKR